MNLADYQQWLNAHGARVIVDNKGGPRTRAATLVTFANRAAPAVTAAQIGSFAGRLGCTVKQLMAVATVESAGGGFQTDGLPRALYERHYFWKRWQVKIPLLSDPAPGGYTVDADGDGINDSWEKVADAAMLSPIAAFESASFGKFQIMGAHAVKLGYANAVEFVWALSRSEAAHYEAVIRYIERNGLRGAVQALSADPDRCRAFARGYNGPAYEKGGYHRKLAEAMR